MADIPVASPTRLRCARATYGCARTFPSIRQEKPLHEAVSRPSASSTPDIGHAEIRRRYAEQGTLIDDEAFPCLAEPLIIDAATGSQVRDVAQRLHPLLERVAHLYSTEAAVRDGFPEYEPLARWLSHAHPLDPINRICRLDGIVSRAGVYKVIESNAVCPAGVAAVPRIHHIWREVFAAPELPPSRPQPLVEDHPRFAQALLACHREQFGSEARSAFVVTLRGRYQAEVPEIVQDLGALGVEAVTVDARSVRLHAGAVVDGRGRQADLVYANLDQHDLITDPELSGYFAAAVSGTACFVNPLLSQCIIGDKRALAVLSDPAFGAHFDDSEREFLDIHVPWTRLITRSDDTLLATLEADRDRFVLKPANRLCGEGVIVGEFVTQSQWRVALSEATAGAYVAQEYCAPPFLAAHPELAVGLDVYLFNAEFVGYMARCSQNPVLNAAVGGRFLPVLEEK
ncbi:hypothetical protein [Nocardia brasiliensis]|uniref:hypothetical protein n=1 Tax=Nocardia brasiliensis TaxID=37326 RepID=UPI00114CE186|nr:hypothetical protein [Nocardia brasiliensis]